MYIGILITITSVITTNYLKVAASVSDDRYLRESSYQSIEEYHESNTLEDETFEISFYLDGGQINGFSTIPNQIIHYGGLIDEPNVPEKELSDLYWNFSTNQDDYMTTSYKFIGWRVAGLNYIKYWDFDFDIVEESVLLWAEWEWPSNTEITNSNFYIHGKYWQDWDYFSRQKFVSVEQIVHGRPIEMKGN